MSMTGISSFQQRHNNLHGAPQASSIFSITVKKTDETYLDYQITAPL
jgi:hypothetical protein